MPQKEKNCRSDSIYPSSDMRVGVVPADFRRMLFPARLYSLTCRSDTRFCGDAYLRQGIAYIGLFNARFPSLESVLRRSRILHIVVKLTLEIKAPMLYNIRE